MTIDDSTPLWRSTGLVLAYAPAAAILNLLPHWHPLLFASGADLYFLPTLAAHDYAAALIWTLVLTGAVLLVVTSIAKSSNRWAPWLMVGFSGLLALNALDFLRAATFDSTATAALPWAAAVAGAAGLIVLAIWRLRGPSAVATTSALAIALFAPLALTTVAQGFVHCVALLLDPEPPTLASAAGDPPSQPAVRVAWLIFDELDRRVLTREDAPYTYPHFESLRDRSVDLTHVLPPGGLTIRAMPSYWLGRRLASSRAQGLTALKIRLEGDGPELPISEFKTIFEELAEAGVATGVVGYYHPYCRLFAAQLSHCATYHGRTLLYYKTETLLESLLTAPRGFYPGRWRRVFISVFERSRDTALELLADPTLDFVLVHLNMPHPPGIYDPETGELRTLGARLSFEGNLVLADLTLGLIKDRMRETGLWDRTVLIVGADHGLRTLQGFDSEPGAVPLIVHLPGQQETLPVDDPVDALLTRPLILALLRGEVSTPAEVAFFLRATSINPESAGISGR